jgi:hypothetical protein
MCGASGNGYTAYDFQMIAASPITLLTDNFSYQFFQFRGLGLIELQAKKLS